MGHGLCLTLQMLLCQPPLSTSHILPHVIIAEPLPDIVPQCDHDSLRVQLGKHLRPTVCQALYWQSKNK